MQYKSSIEYADNPIAQSLKSVSQVLQADFGTRVFYTQHGSFDTHSGEIISHAKLWGEVSGAIGDFYDDLKENGKDEDVIVLVFSEFGRRIKDNGSGTDHGAAGVSFVIGNQVKGGHYGEYPSAKTEDLEQGDLVPNYDFRSDYAMLVEDWFGLDSKPIGNGSFEKLPILK